MLADNAPAAAALLAVIGLLVKELRPSAREMQESVRRIKRTEYANNRMLARLCENFDLEVERVDD